MAEEKPKVKVRMPLKGPIGDEWDSPGYNEFWGPIERAFQKRIKDAEAAGFEVEIVEGD